MKAKALSDRELNQKLMESLNISDSDARRAFDELMKEKVDSIRKEVRKEVYEEMSKQAKVDQERMVDAANDMTKKAIAEEVKKIEIHRKKLIEERLALKKAKDDLNSVLEDKVALVKEQAQKELDEKVNAIKEEYAGMKTKFIDQASKFINESVQSEMKNIHTSKVDMGKAIESFGKFISEQVADKVNEHKNIVNSLEALKVRMVQENEEKLAEAKKSFINEVSGKVSKFISENVNREITEFRTDLAESRKKNFGMKLFEAFANEFAVKFFNEDKVVKSTMESIKASQTRLMQANKLLENEKAKLQESNAQLSKANNKLLREQIINESVSMLDKSKQSMIRSLVKDVETTKLKECIEKYIPMVLKGNSTTTVNNNRVLKENKKVSVLTGSRPQTKMTSYDMDGLSTDVEAEIEEIIKRSKLC